MGKEKHAVILWIRQKKEGDSERRGLRQEKHAVILWIRQKKKFHFPLAIRSILWYNNSVGRAYTSYLRKFGSLLPNTSVSVLLGS